jgi:hypothetical protein
MAISWTPEHRRAPFPDSRRSGRVNTSLLKVGFCFRVKLWHRDPPAIVHLFARAAYFQGRIVLQVTWPRPTSIGMWLTLGRDGKTAPAQLDATSGVSPATV